MSESLPVLVVEDDEALREALTDTLEMAGYGAIAAGNAEQAKKGACPTSTSRCTAT